MNFSEPSSPDIVIDHHSRIGDVPREAKLF
jgi:hypothetical protein